MRQILGQETGIGGTIAAVAGIVDIDPRRLMGVADAEVVLLG